MNDDFEISSDVGIETAKVGLLRALRHKRLEDVAIATQERSPKYTGYEVDSTLIGMTHIDTPDYLLAPFLPGEEEALRPTTSRGMVCNPYRCNTFTAVKAKEELERDGYIRIEGEEGQKTFRITDDGMAFLEAQLKEERHRITPDKYQRFEVSLTPDVVAARLGAVLKRDDPMFAKIMGALFHPENKERA